MPSSILASAGFAHTYVFEPLMSDANLYFAFSASLRAVYAAASRDVTPKSLSFITAKRPSLSSARPSGLSLGK